MKRTLRVGATAAVLLLLAACAAAPSAVPQALRPAGAIPWLLLAARADGPDGVFGGVTFIQRINTAGGSAPSGPRDTPGRPLHVPYSADYNFFRSQA